MALIGDVKEREHRKFIESPTRPNQTAIETFVGNQKYKRVPISTGSEDSFGRIKTANPHLLFDSSFQYSNQDELFIIRALNGATVAHNANRACITISANSTAGSEARYRTRNYFPYSPAFTNTLFCSFNFNGHSAGYEKSIGQYDLKNGYLLQSVNGKLRVVIRSTIGGVTTENFVEQQNWNMDKLDGTGESGVTIDVTKQQILHVQYQWLGSGTVTFSFVIGDYIIPAHTFYHSNVITSLYSQTGTLPIQASVINKTAAPATSAFMEATCFSLVTNGGMSQHGHLHSISNGATPKNLATIGVKYPILSLRKAAGFTNIPVQVLDANTFCTSLDDFLIQIIWKPTLVGAVWNPVPESYCEFDVAATSFTGGKVVAETYMKGNLEASAPLETLAKFWDLTLGDDFNGVSEIISIVATPLTQNANIFGIMAFKEYE